MVHITRFIQDFVFAEFQQVSEKEKVSHCQKIHVYVLRKDRRKKIMMVKLENGLVYNDNNHFYCSDFEFMLDGANYEKDEDNGRCYRLEDSSCLRADCDGRLVRRRISATVYNQALNKLKSMMA